MKKPPLPEQFTKFMFTVTDNVKGSGSPFRGYWFTIKEDYVDDVQLFRFDKGQLYERFIQEYPDLKTVSAKRFGAWLRQYAYETFAIENPREWRAGGSGYIQFTGTL